MEKYEDEVLEDIGLLRQMSAPGQAVAEWLRAHSEFAPEELRTINVDPLSLFARAAETVRRHKKGLAQLGTLGVSSLSVGFAAGAVIAPRLRHSH